MEENSGVKKAKDVLYVMSEDEELQRLAELKEKWERDEATAKSYHIKQGIELGRKEGKKEGIKEGEQKERLEIAKKMKNKGKNIDEIIEFTGLTKEEIEKL